MADDQVGAHADRLHMLAGAAYPDREVRLSVYERDAFVISNGNVLLFVQKAERTERVLEALSDSKPRWISKLEEEWRARANDPHVSESIRGLHNIFLDQLEDAWLKRDEL